MGVRAQDVPPGLIARLDVTQRFEYTDNPGLETDGGDSIFFGRTVLGFGLESVTDVERFQLNLSTNIEEGREGQSSVDITNSFGDFLYNRETSNARLGITSRYQESDIETFRIGDDFDQNGNVINQTTGTRESFRFGVNAEWGINAPIGTELSWEYSQISFRGTDDPDLNDSNRNDLLGRINFRINPNITLDLTARYTKTDTDGEGVDRELIGLSSGVELEVSPILTVNASLGFERINRSGTETGSDDGGTLAISLERDLPNGSVGLRFNTDVQSNENGRRSFLGVDRDLDLPRGSLSYSLGVSGAGADIGRNPILDVSYREDTRSGALTLSLSQRVLTDTDNQEQINTTLNAGYSYRINRVSSIGADLSLFNRNELGDGENDGQRVQLGLTYRYELTRDWGLVSGYSHTLVSDDDEEDRKRNTVFVGLQRNFSWNP